MELFVHPAFEKRHAIILDLDMVAWDLKGVDMLLNKIMEQANIDVGSDKLKGIAVAQDNAIAELHQGIGFQASGIIDPLADAIDGGIAEFTKTTDYLADSIFMDMDKDVVRGIAEGIVKKLIQVLELAGEAKSRKNILIQLNLVNNANNFENYIQPLVAIKWLTMTIPQKPTSPNQQYITTLKDKLVIKFLNLKRNDQW